MWNVMRRPRWLGMLALVLVVAGIFAALAQWQISRAIENAVVVERDTETLVPLDTLQEPQAPTRDAAAEHRVEVSGQWVAEDFAVISDRVQGDLTGGYWVIGRFAVAAAGENPDASLAVALGWAADREEAEAQAEELNAALVLGTEAFAGRYYPAEAPDARIDGLLPSMAPAALVNLWQGDGPDTVFSGYLITEEAPASLEPIIVREPETTVEFSWLNIFYAVEWVLFGGFALYLWYRMVKDAWLDEQEVAAEALAVAAADPEEALAPQALVDASSVDGARK